MKRISDYFAPALVGTLLCAVAAQSKAFNLPDSDQRNCYRDVTPYDEIPCAGTGQDGAYIHNPLSYTDNGTTVTDNNTGLVWQKEDFGRSFIWYEASGTYDATWNPELTDVCGSLDLGGATNWRLPSKKELKSIVDVAIWEPGPTIHPVFTNTTATCYWSSTSYAASSRYYAWEVGFHNGQDGPCTKHNDHCYVRCVRGVQTPGPTLTNNGNGTVTDRQTGLIWQRSEPGNKTWGSALSYCEGLDLGGSTSWRLPNYKELESLTDDTRSSPVIDTGMFPNAHASNYWSSTSFGSLPFYAWYVNFDLGPIGYYSKDQQAMLSVRCVRGGQSGALHASSGTLDGWVLEISETADKGGTMNAATTIRIGDDKADRQYRGILSFDTSGLPDNAVISSAKLNFKKQAIGGANPFGTHGALYVDAVKGAFSGKSPLQPADFQALPTQPAAFTVPNKLVGGRYTAPLSAKGLSAINKKGVTQFRLRFAKDDNDDGNADYLSIYSGNAPAASRPVLEVLYQVP